MACIEIKNIQGETKLIPQNTQYAIDWTFTGKIEWDCGNESLAKQGEGVPIEVLLTEMDKHLGTEGHGPGDWLKYFVAPIAIILGKQGCTSCETRRVIANAYHNLKVKHGKVLALLKIWRLWRLSIKDPEKAALKLKEYIF
jgi:hypothetical protein